MREYNSPQFVACEVGFWQWPQTLMLAQLLNEDPMLSGARILKLREYVLTSGDFGGELKASPEEIAVVCGWRKAAKVIVAALQKVRIITGRRMKWQYVDWRRTRTGNYQERRQADADWHRKDREEKRRSREAAAAAKAPGGGGAQEKIDHPSADGLPMSAEKWLERKKERTSADAAPPSPPDGGCDWWEDWEWFLKTYPSIRNPRRSMELFGGLTREDHARIRIHVPRSLLKKNSKFVKASDLYLKQGTWWSVRDLPKPKSAEETEGEAAKTRIDKEEELAKSEREREIMARRFELKQALKGQGLKGMALEEAAHEALEKELKRGAIAVPGGAN